MKLKKVKLRFHYPTKANQIHKVRTKYNRRETRDILSDVKKYLLTKQG